VLGSPPVAASWCALLDLTLLLFARGLPAAVLGAVGVLAALEALSGAARGSRGALWWYALYSAANVAASAALGIVVLAGVDVDCVGSDNPPACQLTQSVTGILLLCVLRARVRVRARASMCARVAWRVRAARVCAENGRKPLTRSLALVLRRSFFQPAQRRHVERELLRGRLVGRRVVDDARPAAVARGVEARFVAAGLAVGGGNAVA